MLHRHEIDIRPAAEPDLPEMLRVLQQSSVDAYSRELGVPHKNVRDMVESDEYIAARYENWGNILDGKTDARLFVALINQTVVGLGKSSRGANADPGAIEIGDVYLLPEMRCQKIGTYILDVLLEPYDDEDVYLQTTWGTWAFVFYWKRGFRPTGRNTDTAPGNESLTPSRPLEYEFELPQIEMVRKRKRHQHAQTI